MRRNMAKPLQGREMSAVTISVSVSCLPVSGSATEQVSLETRLKQLPRSFLAVVSMPVVQPRYAAAFTPAAMVLNYSAHH